jgi:competence protein ComEA
MGGRGRERVLAGLVLTWLAVAGGRSAAATRAPPEPLPCAADDVGWTGSEARCGAPGALPEATKAVLGLPLDLNLATEVELEALPGIGAGLARRIVDERTSGGPFSSVEGLLRVEGLGKGRLARLLNRVTVKQARVVPVR